MSTNKLKSSILLKLQSINVENTKEDNNNSGIKKQNTVNILKKKTNIQTEKIAPDNIVEKDGGKIIKKKIVKKVKQTSDTTSSLALTNTQNNDNNYDNNKISNKTSIIKKVLAPQKKKK